MRDVYVIGVAQTPFGKFLERNIKSLTEEAVTGAQPDIKRMPIRIVAIKKRDCMQSPPSL